MDRSMEIKLQHVARSLDRSRKHWAELINMRDELIAESCVERGYSQEATAANLGVSTTIVRRSLKSARLVIPTGSA